MLFNEDEEHGRRWDQRQREHEAFLRSREKNKHKDESKTSAPEPAQAEQPCGCPKEGFCGKGTRCQDAQAEQPRNEPVPGVFVAGLGHQTGCSSHDSAHAICNCGYAGSIFATSPQAQPMSDEQIKELEEMNAQLREQNNMVSQACADLERQLEQARSVVNSASALVEAKGLNLHASMAAFTNLEAAIKESK
jgi:hypothetical protein